MKQFVVLVVVVLASFIAGYVLEPSMRGVLIAQPRAAEPAPAPSPEPAPAPVAPEPAPEPAPAPEPEPEGTPAPEPEPTPASPGEAEIRRAMESSIALGETTRITAGQITAWKAFGEEQIDGTTCQFGIITYREPTIFGEAEREAKAIIRDGKVEQWIWTSNGMRIP